MKRGELCKWEHSYRAVFGHHSNSGIHQWPVHGLLVHFLSIFLVFLLFRTACFYHRDHLNTRQSAFVFSLTKVPKNIFFLQFIDDDAHRDEINAKVKSSKKEEPKTTIKGDNNNENKNNLNKTGLRLGQVVCS